MGVRENPGTKKQANIELLRILAMGMILTLHYLLQGQLLDTVQPGTANYYFVWGLEALCYVSVNSYVFISGYFLIKSKFHISKLLKLFIQILFYSVGLYLLYCAIGVEQFQLKSLLFGYLFPVTHGQFWFATAYLALYLIFPFLNILIYALKKWHFQWLLCVLFLLFSLIPTLFFFSTDIMGVQAGYSLVWFIYLYLIGGYIRLHYDWKKQKKWKYLAVFVGMSSVTFASKILTGALAGWTGKQLPWDMYQYNSVPVLAASVGLFLFFLNLSIRGHLKTRIICAVSATTFGIFLIHTHYISRDWLWNDLLKPFAYADSSWLAVHLFVCVAGLFILCGVIDWLRSFVFRLFKIDSGLKRLEHWLLPKIQIGKER